MPRRDYKPCAPACSTLKKKWKIWNLFVLSWKVLTKIELADKISQELASYSKKMEYLENQRRRNNIRATGIPESDIETWEDAEVKVKQAIKENLGIAVDNEGAHRVERRKTKSGQANQNQPRTIVCRLRDWEQKEQVLQGGRSQTIFISEKIYHRQPYRRESRKFVSLKKRQRIVLTTC